MGIYASIIVWDQIGVPYIMDPYMKLEREFVLKFDRPGFCS